MSTLTPGAILALLQAQASLEGINLSGANLESLNLAGAHLHHANLWGVNLSRANLEGADLEQAELHAANLSEVKCLMSHELRQQRSPPEVLQRRETECGRTVQNTLSSTHDRCCHEPRLDIKPPGPNCRCPYPLAKGGRDSFSANVIRPVHIAVDQTGAVGTIPAPVPPAAEVRVGDLHELLVVLPPQLNPLLPQRVLADDQHADPFRHQQLDDATAGRVQGLKDMAGALRRQSIPLTGGKTVGLSKLLVQLGALFVVELIGRLQRAAIHQTWGEAQLVGREAHLIYRLPGLLGLPQDTQTTNGDQAPVELPLPDGSPLVDEEVPPGCFVFVLRLVRAPGERFGMLTPGVHSLKEGSPAWCSWRSTWLLTLRGSV